MTDAILIGLYNLTNNNATCEMVLGARMFVIYVEHNDKIYGNWAKRLIKKMIAALEEFTE